MLPHHPKTFLYIDTNKIIIDALLVYVDWKYKEEICDHLMKTASSWILN